MSVNICAVCAWRKDCAKKFSVSGRDVRCADFSRDLTIKDKEEQEKKPADEKDKEC